MAYGAVVGDVAEFVEMLDRNAAPGLLFVQKSLDQQRGGEDLVARAIQQIGARNMRVAHRLALAAAQAVLDRIGDFADLGLLHDQRFGFQQREAGGVGIAQIGAGHQLALVEAALRIDFLLVAHEALDRFVFQKFQLGEADAVLARDHAAQVACQVHDARHRRIGGLQHGVVVGIDRQIGVHVAVAGVHVQRHEIRGSSGFVHEARRRRPVPADIRVRQKSAASSLAHFALPRHAQGVILQRWNTVVWPLDATSSVLAMASSALAGGASRLSSSQRQRARVLSSKASARSRRSAVICGSATVSSSWNSGSSPLEKRFQRVQQFELVGDGQLDVDALHAVGIIRQPVQRNHHVLVDLEGVGMGGDGGGAGAVEPEFLARFGRHGDEAFTAAGIGQLHDVRGSFAASGFRHPTPHRRAGSSSGARCGWPWWRSPPP